MNLGAWIRQKGFWACDMLLFHGEHRKIYREVREAYRYGTNGEVVGQKLEKLLKHASATTKFYALYKEIKELDQFPIVNKINYQQKWNDFVSSEYVNDRKCHLECTSGSTGTPLEILYDQRKSRRRNATSIFLNTLADYQIGDRQIFMRIWVNRVKKGFVEKKMLNLLPVDTTNLDDKHLGEICRLIERKHVKSIVGYASSLAMLSAFIKDNQIDCSTYKVKSITPISEAMPPKVRKQLQDQFQCTVSSVYGAEEFGTIGVQLKDSDDYYIDTSGVYLEVLKMEADIPAEDGELGRLVITDLYNYAFPLIRYENGDIVVRKTEKTGSREQKQYFTRIDGRRSDLLYAVNGEPVSPHLLTNKMWGIKNISQWKFIQTGEKTYRFIINGNQADEAHIRNLICEELGAEAEISFEYVDEIPVLSSGKRKYIENHYKKKRLDE